MGWHKVPLYMVFMHGGKKKEISTIWISKAKNLSNVTILKSAIIFKEKLPRHRILTSLKKCLHNSFARICNTTLNSLPCFQGSKSSRLRCVSDLIETGLDCIHSGLCTFCTENILKQAPSTKNQCCKSWSGKRGSFHELHLFNLHISICSII